MYAALQSVYAALGEMAFWQGKPAIATMLPDLDWSVPKVTVTITNSIGANAVIKRNGIAVGSTVQVDQGDSLTLTIEAADGIVLSNVAATVGGSAVQLTENSGVYTLAIAQVNADVTVVISGTSNQAYGITYSLTNCTKTSGPTSVMGGSSATIELEADEGCTMPATFTGTVTGASVESYTRDSEDVTKATLVIEGVTGAVEITFAAVSEWEEIPRVNQVVNDEVTRYAILRGNVYPNGSYNIDASVLLAPQLKMNGNQPAGLGDSDAYFLPTNGHNTITVKAVLPDSMQADYYLAVDVSYFYYVSDSLRYRFKSRDAYVNLKDGVNQATFTMPSDVTVNNVKIHLSLQNASDGTSATSTAAESLLSKIRNGEGVFQYKLSTVTT